MPAAHQLMVVLVASRHAERHDAEDDRAGANDTKAAAKGSPSVAAEFRVDRRLHRNAGAGMTPSRTQRIAIGFTSSLAYFTSAATLTEPSCRDRARARRA